jgi:hypothetical protein
VTRRSGCRPTHGDQDRSLIRSVRRRRDIDAQVGPNTTRVGRALVPAASRTRTCRSSACLSWPTGALRWCVDFPVRELPSSSSPLWILGMTGLDAGHRLFRMWMVGVYEQGTRCWVGGRASCGHLSSTDEVSFVHMPPACRPPLSTGLSTDVNIRPTAVSSGHRELLSRDTPCSGGESCLMMSGPAGSLTSTGRTGGRGWIGPISRGSAA